MVWIHFLLSAALVVAAGIAISRFSQVIAVKSKLGGLWVGSILLALGTSLPEVVAGISSGILGLPNLALGNVLGSNIFNIAIIALVDMMDGDHSILRKVRLGHILTANVGIFLSLIVGIALFVDLPYRIGWVGLDTIILAPIYLFGLRLITAYEGRKESDQAVIPTEHTAILQSSDADTLPCSLRSAYIGFVISAVVIAVAGTMLSITSDKIAIITGLGATFVGTTLLAISTSLPEVVTSISAVRSGAFDLAIGNLLGSNIFNMLILMISDIAYRPGSIIADASESHVLTAMFGMAMSTIVATAIFYRSKKSYGRLGPDSIIIITCYLIANYYLFATR